MFLILPVSNGLVEALQAQRLYSDSDSEQRYIAVVCHFAFSL